LAQDEVVENEADLKNDEWFKQNFYDLIQKYPREWIAVMEQKVIANSPSKSEVVEKADDIAGERGYSLYFIPPTATVTDTGYAHN